MSMENAKKFLTELCTNEAMKEQFKGIEDEAAFVAKAVEAGYDVTAQELGEALKELREEMAAKTDGKITELGEDDLDAVAGGGLHPGCTLGRVITPGPGCSMLRVVQLQCGSFIF